jgi:two-component system sensor histidine kinase TctE
LLLHELLANLVDNALRYTPAGGSVILRVRSAQQVLEVEDSGPGIAGRRTRTRVRAVLPRRATLEINPGGHGLGWPSCATSPPCTAPASA